MPIRRPNSNAPATTRPKFEYNPRTASDLKRRATQGGTSRDGFVNADVKFFTPKPGDNRIRVLPPTWENADHFGFEVFVHYGVGTDNSAYACLDKNASATESGPCPVCAERSRADSSGEKEYADSLRPNKRVSVYVVDRDRQQEGVLFWNMPWTVDRDLCARAVDKITGEVYNLDDPESGYDVTFTREGQGQTTKYIGTEIARRPSPLSDDPAQQQVWLDYALAHPIPTQIMYHSAEHIAKVFSGQASAETKPEPQPTARAPAAGGMALTATVVLGMTEEQLLALIEERALEARLGGAFDGELPDLKKAVCDLLWPLKKTTAAPKPGGSLKERLAKLSQRSAS